jgi:NADH-quinone oxidoreductase subunit H
LLLCVVLSVSCVINDICKAQGSLWYLIVSPLAALIFLISAQAELGRAPFDISEAESEIVAGFHIEYTGMKFGLFYAGELLHAMTFGALFAALFLGGWRGPGVDTYPMLGLFYFFIKTMILYFVIGWIKYSLPRVRIDQMLNFTWKFLTPLALVLVMVTAVLAKLMQGFSPYVSGLVFFLVNAVLVLITIQILRTHTRQERKRVAEPRPVARSSEAPVEIQ